MKNFLRTIIGLSVIMLAMSVTALSCDKVGDDKNNANNSGGGGTGGGGNGGGGVVANPGCTAGTTGTNICFEISDADVAQQTTDGTIQLKVSGFPQTVVSTDIANTDIGVVKTTAAANFKKAFDLTIKVDGTAAKEGLVLVGPGSLANATNFSIGQAVAEGITDYDAALRKEGIVSEIAAADANGLKAGWNILGSFMSTAAPTADADASPFAFTATTGPFATKPILFCRTTISTITDSAAAGAGTVQADTKLTGGQTASCYIGALGANFKDKAADDWLKSTTANFKKKFNIAVAGIKTDDKTIGGVADSDRIGLPGNDDNARIAAFKNGISTDDMTALTSTTAKNANAYRKFTVEVVAGTFMHTPPVEGTIVFENFDTDVAEQQTDGTIQLKASGFPQAAVSANIAGTDISVVKTAAAAEFKKAFDIRVSSGNTAATGGLLLVGPGNLADVNAFSIGKGVAQGITDYDAALRKEGVVSDAATGTATGFLAPGWNILTPFMNSTAPTDAAEAAAGASPFAFTATTGTFGTKPIMFCKTTITTITDGAAAGVGTVQANTQLTGGQKASCYVGVLGVNFVTKAADDWLKKAAGNTFKKKFNISVAGIKTDTKTINDIGLTAADKVAAFKDGISQAEMAEIALVNSSKYTNVAIEMVAGTFTYTPPPATITFENFNTDVAEMVGDTIRLKASGFPTNSITSDITGANARTIIINVSSTRYKKAFEIVMKSGTIDADGGLVMVGPGNFASVNDFSLGGIDDLVTTYPLAQQREGITTQVKSVGGNPFLAPSGWAIHSLFSKPDAPTSATEAAAGASPFAFTPTTGHKATQPVLYCRTSISSITYTFGNDPSTVAFDDKTTLAGGQRAVCYVASLGNDFVDRAAFDWLDKAASDTFKKKFDIAVGWIRTDAKTVAQLGLSGADDATKAAAFRDGITTAEMQTIAADHSSGYKKVSVEVVKDTGFTYTPPVGLDITAISPATGVTIDNNNNTITIAASAFPTAAADSDITKGFGALSTAAANSLVKVFDITFTGGDATAITGGLVMVGPGNFTAIDSFSDNTTGRGTATDLPGTFKEGFGSGIATPTTGVNANGYNATGQSYYGVFMNDVAPTSAAEAAVGASPFAFTPTTGANATQPFLFCRATVTKHVDLGGDVRLDYAGGQTASCYIGAKGAAFTGAAATGWTGTTASDTFKKEFKIAVGAVRTDALRVNDFLPGPINSLSQHISQERGFEQSDFRHMGDNYPNRFETFTVKIVP